MSETTKTILFFLTLLLGLGLPFLFIYFSYEGTPLTIYYNRRKNKEAREQEEIQRKEEIEMLLNSVRDIQWGPLKKLDDRLNKHWDYCEETYQCKKGKK